ncbi:hypothetical protein Glove_16g218 [Diversispora epigaea]|uniref:Uncharacterized protein n=1 Tax=Diversispora epigaea TaxID=1348612 RepID=A0A397JWM7_9GLOM|nr:hypothetical protein Glove_16g218 [Diversispora epigaea]
MPIPPTPAITAFYRDIAIEDWTFVNIEEYYREKIGIEDTKKVKDYIKKDLLRVANSDFDATRKGKAKEILDDWKIWSAPEHPIKIGNLQINQIATGSGTTRIDNLQITNKRHHRDADDEERLTLKEFSTKKMKPDEPILVNEDQEKSIEEESISSLSEKDLKRFEEKYLRMRSDQMWTLKSGRKVEEIVYGFAQKLAYESYLHSFIINESDTDTRSLFSEDEWKEVITSEVKERPRLEDSLKELLKKYTVVDVEKLRKILFEPFTPNECKYDQKFHFDLDFINRVYRGMLPLWERNDNSFDLLKPEAWYQMNVWSHLVDPVFYNVNIDLIRGEETSLVKNKGGIFRICGNFLEFGSIETGRKCEGTDRITDSLKTCKMLKGMINQLATECNMDEDYVRKLQVVGMLQSANRMQVITVDLPKGYITRVRRRKVCEVAGRLTKSKPLALVLKEIFYVKDTILQTLEIINHKDDVNTENFLEDSDEERQ